MKNLIAFLAFVMMSQAQAQAPSQVQVLAPQAAPIVAQAAPAQPKKTLIYDERTNQLVEVAPQVQAQATAPSQVQAEATANAPSASPIYILNNQRLQGYQGATQGAVQGTSAVQDAPTTVVQEAPVKVSASETIRKERQGAEAATEDGIVQTLEKARLDDEVRRREKFNAALTPPAQAPVVVAAPVVQQQVSTVTATQVIDSEVIEEAPQKPQKASKRKKVVLEDETRDEKFDVKAEIRAAMAEQNSAPAPLTSYYIAGLVGTANYVDAANIRTKLSSGFSLGMVTPERFVFEGSFLYGQSEIDNIAGPNANYLTYDIAQYNFSAAAKYQLLPGKLRPTVGAIASYTHRSYSMANGQYGYGYSSGSGSGSELGSTDAFDAGLEAGLDLALTNSFSIGADFRYLWNIATKDANSNSYRGYNYGGNSYTNAGVPVVEDLAYYIATLSAKFTF